MKLVMQLVVRDEEDVLDAQIAFHLNAGVDLVIATDHDSRDGSREILEVYARDGYVLRIPENREEGEVAWRASMARRAVEEHGADWLIDADSDEFWMPRAESLKDVLVAIPDRYSVVQALTRVFLPRPDATPLFAERMTVRRAPYSPDDESAGRLDWALRLMYRAGAESGAGADREIALDGRVPLRAWYPIEVLRYPVRSLEQAERRALGRSGPAEVRSGVEKAVVEAYEHGNLEERWPEFVVGDEALSRGLADGSLVIDDRLSDALGRLEGAAEDGSSRRFALPTGGSGRLELRVPTIVDDVAYAGECAALREVDFDPLRVRVAELEQRIASLEARFWPRLRRRLARAVRR